MTDEAKPAKRVYLTVDRSGYGGSLQMSINVEDVGGGGHGYRIHGPKYAGNSTLLLKHYIDERDVREIERYLKIVKDQLAEAAS